MNSSTCVDIGRQGAIPPGPKFEKWVLQLPQNPKIGKVSRPKLKIYVKYWTEEIV
jgi:hypothetical protein